jgi:carbonic anhydrase/acetyltransferase-like protein (isoleucine patch superfamily)
LILKFEQSSSKQILFLNDNSLFRIVLEKNPLLKIMALIKSVRGFSPKFGNDCYFAENATIIGDVIMGDECSVWFQAVVRGDVHSIRIGNKVNIQDGAIIHCTYQRAPTTIGNNVSVGHRAIVHGCTLHDNILVGMGAMIMDHAVVESNCLIAAGAVVLENSHLQSHCIYAGVPAKKVKELSPEQFADTIGRISNAYVMYASWFKEEE